MDTYVNKLVIVLVETDLNEIHVLLKFSELLGRGRGKSVIVECSTVETQVGDVGVGGGHGDGNITENHCSCHLLIKWWALDGLD